jgi:hypothetical protein
MCLLISVALFACHAPSIAQDTNADEPEEIDAVVLEQAQIIDDEPIWPVARGIDPAADRILRAMSDYIAAADTFTFSIEVAEDVLLDHGQMVSYGRSTEVAVQRPGSVHAHSRGEEREVRLVIHDGRCLLFDMENDVYAVADVPKVIGDAIDVIIESYGLNIPAADILYPNPYQEVIGNVDYGFVAGTTMIDGTECHHLAFAQEIIDWQVWIQTGPHPLLRKIVISYKDEEGWPSYTARLSDWKFPNRISKHHFEYVPPATAREIEFLPNQTEEDE